MTHPWLVWSVTKLVVAKLTCSMMSISPPFGQLGPVVQLYGVSFNTSQYGGETYNAGQMPHAPPGM